MKMTSKGLFFDRVNIGCDDDLCAGKKCFYGLTSTESFETVIDGDIWTYRLAALCLVSQRSSRHRLRPAQHLSQSDGPLWPRGNTSRDFSNSYLRCT
ncbi:hypothetical protein BHE74_00047670 [Ensete ventricosum]|nr:hypothetical protein BHE74_00047670 [Ensete ventricosum]